MTRKISLIVGIAVAALAVGIPTALGGGRLAGSPQPSDAVNYFYNVERATTSQPDPMIEDGLDRAVATKLALQSTVSSYRDANERGATTKPSVQSSLSGYGDAFERTDVAGQPSLSTYRDAFERGAPVAGPTDVPTISSGREIEWPQLGIGFGLGIVLVVGLWLAMRVTRIRPLSH